MDLTDFTIPGSSQTFHNVVANPVDYETEYTTYIGKYESNIYYHIVFY